MRGQESKYEKDSFMKVATNVVFTQIYAMAGIEKFGDKSVSAIVK